VADFGQKVYHVKCLIIMPTKSMVFKFRSGGWGKGPQPGSPILGAPLQSTDLKNSLLNEYL
jgi:hypothetical protein